MINGHREPWLEASYSKGLRFSERDYFMSGQKALEYGIVDKVITKREMVSIGKNNKNKEIHAVD